MPITSKKDNEQKDLVDYIVCNWHKSLPSLDTRGTQTIGRIVRLNHFISRKVDSNLARFDLAVGEFDVLAALRRQEKPFCLTPTRLQELVMISSGGLSNRINRLEKRELITRLPDPSDRRGVIVQLTEKGLQLIDEVAPRHLSVESEIVQHLTEEEQATLAMLLKKILLSEEEND